MLITELVTQLQAAQAMAGDTADVFARCAGDCTVGIFEATYDVARVSAVDPGGVDAGRLHVVIDLAD